MPDVKSPFVTAECRYPLMLNYFVDPNLLRPLVPPGTELDFWNRRTYMSLVAFLFLNTKVMGLPVPFHRNFEEVNLRFYVRRKTPEGWRRGVVFIREIVPRLGVALVANSLYKEHYESLPMRHQVSLQGGTLEPDSQVSYSWKKHGRWNSIQARITGTPNRIEKDSEEEFITENYWGYSSRKRGGCIEYPVARSSWKVWQVSQCSLDCDIESVYGKDFVEALTHPPTSAFVGEGSSVAVGRGLKLESPGIAFHRPRLFPV